MLSLRAIFYSLCLVFGTFASISAQADTVVEDISSTSSSGGGQVTIVTPAPTAKEVISTPQGFANCFTIKASWYKNTWIPEHRICQYENAAGQTVTYQGVAWVDSYWACTQFTGTTCTKWEWKPGHWVKTLAVY